MRESHRQCLCKSGGRYWHELALSSRTDGRHHLAKFSTAPTSTWCSGVYYGIFLFLMKSCSYFLYQLVPELRGLTVVVVVTLFLYAASFWVESSPVEPSVLSKLSSVLADLADLCLARSCSVTLVGFGFVKRTKVRTLVPICLRNHLMRVLNVFRPYLGGFSKCTCFQVRYFGFYAMETQLLCVFTSTTNDPNLNRSIIHSTLAVFMEIPVSGPCYN